MNAPEERSLGGFEQRLLRELRHVVADGAASAPVSPDPALAGTGRKRRRWPLALAGGLAAAIAALFLSGSPFGGDDGGRAWAVTSNDDGTVSVEIDSLTDAAGLQRKLNEAGIPALVQYLPPGKTCAGGELSPPPVAVTQTNGDPSAPTPPPGAKHSEYGASPAGPAAGAGPLTQTEGDPSGGQPQGGGERGSSKITVQHANGGVEFTIYEQPHPSGTLVILAQGLASGEAPASQSQGAADPGTISVSQVQGQAQPCKVVDSPAQ
jgi:hypothetical protein